MKGIGHLAVQAARAPSIAVTVALTIARGRHGRHPRIGLAVPVGGAGRQLDGDSSARSGGLPALLLSADRQTAVELPRASELRLAMSDGARMRRPPASA